MGAIAVLVKNQVMHEELAPFTDGKFSEARTLFRALSTAAEFEEFLTLPAYQRLLAAESLTQ